MRLRQAANAAALDHLLADLRYALRGMRRAPGFSAVAVLMLALGIGINAAIFSVFSHVLLAPLQFPDSGQLYVVSSHAPSLGDSRRDSSGPDFRDYRDQNTVFSEVAAVIPHFSEPFTPDDGPPRVLNFSAITPQFFSMLGVRPLMGRLFTADEYKTLRNSSVLISWKFWQQQYGGDPNVIGRVLRNEDVNSVIVGVMPPMPDLYPDIDVWDKSSTEPSWPFMNWRQNKFLDVIGRLKPGVSRQMAEQQLTAILRRGQGEPSDVQVRLTSLKEFVVGPVKQQLNILMAAVALVLLVTCMNTAALLLSRAVKRTPEMAVRLGLGASRTRISQQLLVEGLALSVMGGALGVALASASVGLIRQIPGLALPRVDGLRLNLAALGASFALVALTSVVFAMLPANALRDLDLSSGLRGARTETGRRQRRPFSALIVAEVACAVVLTVCAGLLLRSFVKVQSVDAGFQPSRVLTAYLRTNYFGPEGLSFWHSVIDGVGHVPGATAAAVSDCMPGSRAMGASLIFDDRPNDPAHAPSAEGCWISSDYFRVLGSSLLKGRFFTEHDNGTSPPVIMVNAAAAQRFFPNQDPLGKRIAVNYLALGSRNNRPPPLREIVGVVENVHQRALDQPAEPSIYVPYLQDDTYHVLASMNLFVRSAGGDPAALADSVRAKIQSLDPNQPVERTRAMREVVSRTLARRTYSMGLMTAFAGLALLLCALGIYGVVSYVTLQRTREFGIRMALGASREDVLRNVLAQGGTLTLAGLGIGITLALPATRALAQFLFQTAPLDPAILAASVLLLGAIGILACLLPGMRAAQLDPRVALNSE
ncbi:MAG: ABC transporter permease [Acidobacteria bacterium]|nr:ABC transporter permease [Acidobacteriota bacterium]